MSEINDFKSSTAPMAPLGDAPQRRDLKGISENSEFLDFSCVFRVLV